MFSRLTGAAGRHNRALGEVKDWADRVEKFLVAYGLDKEDAGPGGLLGSRGDAKFDLTGISYTGRGLGAIVTNVRDKRIADLVAGTLENVESIRRYLINPSLQGERLAAAVVSLRANFTALHIALNEISIL